MRNRAVALISSKGEMSGRVAWLRVISWDDDVRILDYLFTKRIVEDDMACECIHWIIVIMLVGWGMNAIVHTMAHCPSSLRYWIGSHLVNLVCTSVYLHRLRVVVYIQRKIGSIYDPPSLRDFRGKKNFEG